MPDNVRGDAAAPAGFRFLPLHGIALAAALTGLAPRSAAAQQDSLDLRARLERQEKMIARLDSELTALRSRPKAAPRDSGSVMQAGAPVGAAPAPARPAPMPVVAGVGSIRVDGLIQAWYAQGDGGFQNTFRLRRAEFKLAGDISSKARWTINVDAAKALSTTSSTTTINGTKVLTAASVNQGGRILQDAFVSLGLPADLRLDMGQYKIPLGYEGAFQSTAALETVERSLFASDRARGGTYSDARDLGATLRGAPGHRVEYSLGVFNGVGESQNETDRNQQKAVVGRLAVKVPLVANLTVGASGAWSTKSDPDTLIRQRGGADAKLVAGPLMMKSEVMMGRDGQRRGVGYYGHVGYQLSPALNLLARYDVFDPDVHNESSLADARESDFIGGFSYDIPASNVRLQVNYLRKLVQPDIAPARGLMLVNLQTAW